MFGQGFNYGFLGKPPCFTDTTDIFKDNSGVALYTLDYDASDAGGATGKFGEGAVFNGSSSRISLSSGSFQNTILSVSAWINVSNTSSTRTIIETYGYSGSSKGWLFRLISGKLQFDGYNGDPASTVLRSNESIPLNTWTHVAVVFSANTTGKLYINGSEVTYATQTVGTVGYISNEAVNIGALQGTGVAAQDYFIGSIDQVRIFNKEISSSEVTTLYNETKNTTNTLQILGDTSCIATYPLDGSSTDLSGNYNGTDTNILYKYDGIPTNVDFGVGGKSLYGARFNGSSGRVDLPNSFGITDSANFSASLWFNSNSTANQSLLWANGSGAVGRFGIGINNSSYGGAGAVYFGCGLSSFTYINSSGGTFSQGDWVHVAVAKSSTTGMTLYVNGTQVANNSSATGNASNTATGSNTIGVYKTGSYSSWYNGSIDQVRIFSKALSSSEVSKLYGNGTGEIACAHKSTTDIVNYPTGTTPVAYYKLDNSSEDYSTGGYDATTTNVSYEFGRFGQAAHFSSGTFLTSSFASLTQVTVSFWVKMTDVNTTRAFFVSRYGTNREFAVYTYDNSFVASIYYNGNNGNATILTASDYFNDNTWHHIAYTANGSTSPKLYIDGVESGSAQYSDATRCAYYTSSEPLSMGYSRTSSAYSSWDGRLDQVRIYSTALTDEQVTKLYNEKPEVDTSNFKAVLYEGNNSHNYISNVGFQPDLVWTKPRTNAGWHWVANSIVGGTLPMASNATNSSISRTGHIQSFDANGFTLGSDGTSNGNGIPTVAWVWKGGGDAVVGAGSGVTNVSVSANTGAGFSIVKYRGGNSASDTVNHGLADAEMIILKDLTNANHWRVWHKDLDSDKWLYLSLNLAQVSAATDGGIRYVDSNTFGFINGTTAGVEGVNYASSDYIAYVWKSISGYSKIGSYEGLGTSDVTVSGLGFKPSFIMVKNADAVSNWNIYDTARGTITNRMNNLLYPNLSNAESGAAATMYITVNDNGFVVNNANHLQLNYNGDTFIYMAFK